MRRAWIVLLLVCAAIAAALLGRWNFPPTAWWRTIEDFGHMPMFGVLALAVCLALGTRWRWSEAARYAAAAAITLALGVATEFAQTLVGRDGAWIDLRNDALGIGAALALWAAIDRRRQHTHGLRTSLIVGALLAVAWAAAPVVEMINAYRYRGAIFPELVTFDDKRMFYWTAARGTTIAVRDRALDVTLSDADYPSVAWEEPPPDWSSYDQILIDVENLGARPIELTVRVHDEDHDWTYDDRFNQTCEFQPRERRVLRIALADVANAPRARKLDLRRVSDITLFRSGQPSSREIRLYRLALVRNAP
jgi:hypothetical protein